jgi:hypothetical protein
VILLLLLLLLLILKRANPLSTRVVWHQLPLINCVYEFYIYSTVVCEGQGKKWSWPISAYFSGNFLDGVREATKHLMFHAKVSHRILPNYTSDRMQQGNIGACRTKKLM